MQAVKTIRNNTVDSYIIYGGILWNSASTLKLLDPPADDKIIFTFHFYEPLLFTHQKAYWVETMDPNWEISYPGDKEEYIEKSAILGNQGLAVSGSKYEYFGIEFIEDFVLEAIKVGKERNVRLYCGEFGVIDQAPVEDTLRWFDDVFTVFEKYDIGYAIWTYKEKDFGLVDRHYDPIRNRLIARIYKIKIEAILIIYKIKFTCSKTICQINKRSFRCVISYPSITKSLLNDILHAFILWQIFSYLQFGHIFFCCKSTTNQRTQCSSTNELGSICQLL